MTLVHDNVTPLLPARSRQGMPVVVQGTLALDLTPQVAPPAAEVELVGGADVVAVSPAVRRELHRWTVQFTQACVEVVLGDRPASQLVRWATPEIYHEIRYRAGVVSRANIRRSGGGSRRAPVRPQVQNVRASFVAADVVEMCARVKYGERSRALAGRLEVIDGRWQCTALEFG